MKLIPLSQGYAAMVSDRDYSRLSKIKWHATIIRRKDGSISSVYAGHTHPKHCWMHRVIRGIIDPKIQVDHKDHNGLNNQRRNLRVANSIKNQYNAEIRSDNTSGFKGVSWQKDAQKW